MIGVVDRCETNTAVAHNDCRDAVPGGRSEMVVPCRLSVVMRMDIDEARCHQRSCRIDLPGSLARNLAYLHDGLAIDRHVGGACFVTTSVDNSAATNYQIMCCHLHTPSAPT